MKSKSFGRYLMYSVTGFIIMAVGGISAKYMREAEGILKALPYIFIGIGAGIFGQNLGTAFSIHAARKAPEVAKLKEIEEKDERNIAIRNKAKAKAYDLMVMAFGVMLLTLAMIDVDLAVILSLIAVYLFIVFSNVYFIYRYQKEM